MPVQVNIFLLLFGSLQGLFLSIVLLKKKIYNNGYALLLIYLLLMILQTTLKVMSKIWLMQNLQPLYLLSYQFPLLYGPLVFLFIRQFLLRKKLEPVDSLHFLPALIVITYFIFGDKDSKPPVILTPFFAAIPRLILELISVIVYHFLAWECRNKYKLRLKGHFSEIRKLQLKWLKRFIISSAAICSFISIVIFLMYMWYPYNQEIRFGFIALTIFIYWISYCAWNQPQIFSVIHGNVTDAKEVSIAPTLSVFKTAKKYLNTGLNEEEMKRILSKLKYQMEQQKLYLDAEITIDKLAEKINCSKHHLSQVLNGQLKKSFYYYINSYRVEETKILLTDTSRIDYKIASIAYDAGFNCLSTFNDIFKKYTGLTPSQYRKQPTHQSRMQRV